MFGWSASWLKLRSSAAAPETPFDVATCTALCDNIEDCVSVDMHKSISRCFLNSDGCALTPSDSLLADPMYSLMVKPPPTTEPPTRRLNGGMVPLPVLDIGFSWERMLR